MSKARWTLGKRPLLRLTGFPFALMDRLDFSGSKADIESLLRDRYQPEEIAERVKQTLLQEVERNLDTLREIARDEKFREAMFLSSAGAVHIDKWLFDATGKNPSYRRKCAITVMNYLQRFCLKNDSTSFFGPTSWIELDRGKGAGLSVEGPAPMIRQAFFSHWAAEALAQWALQFEGARRAIMPRRHGGLEMVEGRLRGVSPAADAWTAVPARQLGSACQVIWDLADGERTLAEIEEAARGVHHLGEPDVTEAVASLRDAGALCLEIEIPAGTFEPFDYLASIASRAGLSELSDEVDWFRTKRIEFGQAKSLDERRQVQQKMVERFEATTSAAGTRGAGTMYAGRSIVVDDASLAFREFKIAGELSRRIERLSDLLDLLWLVPEKDTQETNVVFMNWFQRRFADAKAVPFLDYASAYVEDFEEIQRALAQAHERVGSVADELFAALVPLDQRDAEEVVVGAERVAELLQKLGPPSEAGVVANPDLIICAPSVEAINQGSYRLVLGELHAMRDLLLNSPFAFFLGDEGMRAFQRAATQAHARAVGDGFAVANPTRRIAGKMGAHLGLDCVDIEVSARSSRRPKDAIALADLDVVPTPRGLRLRQQGGCGALFQLTGMAVPSGIEDRRSPLLPFSFTHQGHALAVPTELRYVPRLIIDGTVVLRRSWRVEYSAWIAPVGNINTKWSALLFVRLLSLRQQHGMPAKNFVRIQGERKPVYLDFDNYLSVHAFVMMWSKHRQGATVAEALPVNQDAWLEIEGQKRHCEIRMQFYRDDLRPAASCPNGAENRSDGESVFVSP